VTVIDNNSRGFGGANGPWWRADSKSLLFSYADTGSSPPSVSSYNADSETYRPNAEPLKLGCLGGDGIFVTRPLPDGTGVLVGRGEGDGQPTRIERCRFESGESSLLFITPNLTMNAQMNRAGSKVLLGDIDGVLSISTLDGSIRPLSTGPYVSASW
jgi:hypothetical protein